MPGFQLCFRTVALAALALSFGLALPQAAQAQDIDTLCLERCGGDWSVG